MEKGRRRRRRRRGRREDMVVGVEKREVRMEGRI